MVWQKDRRGVSSRPMPFSERGSRCKRIWEQIRSRLGADSVVSGTVFADKYGICIVRLSNLFFSPTNIIGQFHFHKASPMGHASESAVFLK